MGTGPDAGRGGLGVLATALASIAVVALLSGSLELVQACRPARVSSALDLLANVAGGALGIVAGLGVLGSAREFGARAQHAAPAGDRHLRAASLGVAVAWIVGETMPWVFAVDVGTIRSNLSFLRRWSHEPILDLWHVLRHAAAWIAVACACRLAIRDGRAATVVVLLASALSLLLQLLLDARAPISMEELVGMAAAVAVVVPAMIYAGAQPSTARWASALMVAATTVVGAYQLRPEPGATATQPFSLWPRVGLGGLRGAIDYALLFGWFGFVAVIAARWARRAGAVGAARTWLFVAVVAALLLEGMQTRIPGRGPDLSAPVFTLLAVLATQAVVRDGE